MITDTRSLQALNDKRATAQTFAVLKEVEKHMLHIQSVCPFVFEPRVALLIFSGFQSAYSGAQEHRC
jgi:hypothetical protein